MTGADVFLFTVFTLGLTALFYTAGTVIAHYRAQVRRQRELEAHFVSAMRVVWQPAPGSRWTDGVVPPEDRPDWPPRTGAPR